MADLNITPGSVLIANSNTVIATGYSGTVSISAGQVLWLNTATNPPTLSPALGTIQIQAQNVVGIALDNTSASNQLVTYAVSGSVVLPTSGAGGTLTTGATYLLGTASGTALPGKMISPTDMGTAGTAYITLIGMAVDPNTLLVNITPLGAIR